MSVYPKRVVPGEALEVTGRERAVAILPPLGRLVISGRATASVGDLLEFGPLEGAVSTRLNEALIEEREERLP